MRKRKISDRTTRRSRERPPGIELCRATVVGMNGIGRQIAVLLAATGVRSLLLVDHRVVGKRHQEWEGYAAEDVGRMRVHAVAQQCHAIAPRLEVNTASGRGSSDIDLGDVLFWCGTGKIIQCGKSGVFVISCDADDAVITIEVMRSAKSPDAGTPVWNRIPPTTAAVAAGLAVHAYQHHPADRGRRHIQFAMNEA